MNRPRVAARCRCAVAVAVLLAFAGSATAVQPEDQDGPVIVGEHAGEWKAFYLQSFQAELVMNGQYEYNRLETTGQPTLTQRTTNTNISTAVNFESYIGHKNLVDLTGSFQVGYQYLTLGTSVAGLDDKSGSLMDLFNLQALILGESGTPVTVYALREETRETREFASTLTTTTTEYGASIELRSEVVPLKVQYFHRDLTQTDALGLNNQQTLQDTVSFFGSAVLNDSQRLEYYYTFDHIDETQGLVYSNSYDRQDAQVVHSYDFGEAHEHNLHSSLRYYEESGLYSQERLRLDERLVLHHSDRLETHYDLSVEDQTYSGREQRVGFASASVRHSLFDSLVTNVIVGGSLIDVPDEFTSTTRYVTGTVDYTKRVPYGRLDMGVGAGYSVADNGERGSSFVVFDEPRTFNDPFDVTINRRNIVVGSVLITDLAHFPYSDPADYTVAYFPDRIEIHRDPFGSIANGQTVLVTYTVGPEPGNEIDTVTGSYSIRYTINQGPLSGLSFYGYYQTTQQSVVAVDPSLFVLDDVNDLRYGLEYRVMDLLVQVEQENHDSTVSPYDQLHFLARWDQRYSRFASLALELTRDEIDYRFTGNHAVLNRITGRYTQQLDRGMNVSLYLKYRDEHDGIYGDVTGFEQELTFNWRWRQTSFYATLHNTMLDGGVNKGVNQAVLVGLTRSF